MISANIGEARVLLRIVSILASAIRRVGDDPHAAYILSAHVEAACKALAQRGPNGYDTADDHLRDCERLLGEGS